MTTHSQNLVIICLSICALIATGEVTKVKINDLKYCGPPDKTFMYKMTPWPVLSPGDRVNATVKFTPAVDIFASTTQYEVMSKKDHQVFFKDTLDLSCNVVPQICNLAKGETYTLSISEVIMWQIPVGFKGTLIGRADFYNQDADMWSCLEGEAVVF